MKIESAAAYRYYPNYAAAGIGTGDLAVGAPKAENPAHTDKVAFSQTGQRSEFSKLVSRIASEQESGAPAERIQQLKNAVENGEYYVPTSQLADAILNRVV